MTSGTTRARPNGFRAVALLGIFYNSLLLLLLYPLSIYTEFYEPERIPILGFMFRVSLLISIPLTCVLLAGSIGLIYKKSWSRTLCIWAMSAELLFGVCYMIIDTLVRLGSWDDETIFSLMILPLYFFTWVFQVLVLLFLNSTGVKLYLGNYGGSLNE